MSNQPPFEARYANQVGDTKRGGLGGIAARLETSLTFARMGFADLTSPENYVAEDANTVSELRAAVTREATFTGAAGTRALADLCRMAMKHRHGDYAAAYELCRALIARQEWALARLRRPWWKFWVP